MPQKANKDYITQTRFLFHCHVKIKIPLEAGEELLNECFSIMGHYDLHYNSYSEGSYLDRINKNPGQWVEADEHLLYMLSEIEKISKITDGAYNIMLMPLLRLWGFYNAEETDFPSKEDIQDAVAKIQQAPLAISGKKVKIEKGQEIISGSFLKAYAADQVIKYLLSRQVTDALINAGGSTITAINNEEHPFWLIDIPHPLHAGYLKQIRLTNASFSMSGRKEHFRLIAGKCYGHIINAKTGWPASHLQTGVMASSAFLSDILSTALFALDQTDADKTFETLQKAYPHEFSYYILPENWNEETILLVNN